MEYIVIISAALIISFLYLLHKINREIGNIRQTCKRAGLLFLHAAGQSFIIGLVLFDLFADGMTCELIWEMKIYYDVARLPGIVGGIYPLPLILFASLALVIGIFIQMLWEDKPITQDI